MPCAPRPPPIEIALPPGVVCYEKVASRVVVNDRLPSAILQYIVLGTSEGGHTINGKDYDDDEVAGFAVWITSQPLFFLPSPAADDPLGGPQKFDQTGRILKRKSVEIRALAHDKWVGDVRYEIDTEPIISFDTTPDIAHFTTSLKTLKRYPYADGSDGSAPAAVSLAPDFKGLVGVHEKGVDGYDWPVPAGKWVEKHLIPSDLITTEYFATLYSYGGYLNSQPWRNFVKRGVRFMGAVCERQGAVQYAEVTFKFEVSAEFLGPAATPPSNYLHVQNIPESPPGGPPAPPADIIKGAWDYLWIQYEEIEQLTEVPSGLPVRKLVKVPKYVFIEQVGDDFDFALLGIPGCDGSIPGGS